MLARIRRYLANRALEADRARRLAKVPEWQKRRAAALKGVTTRKEKYSQLGSDDSLGLST